MQDIPLGSLYSTSNKCRTNRMTKKSHFVNLAMFLIKCGQLILYSLRLNFGYLMPYLVGVRQIYGIMMVPLYPCVTLTTVTYITKV